MANLDLNKAAVSDYSSIKEWQMVRAETDGARDQKLTEWQNSDWQEEYGAFLNIAEYQNALLLRAVWDTGKGWTTPIPSNKVTLNNISGWGKDTFDDIIFNQNTMSMAAGDSFAHIITHNGKTILEGGIFVNLKPLNPGSMKIFVNREGRIVKYQQTYGSKPFRDFKPEEIFHLSYNRMADQIHGISKYKSLKPIIKADEEMFEITKKVMKNQAVPFIIWKFKTDDEVKISNFMNKVRTLREKVEDLAVPDDENLISWEVVNISPAQLIMAWREDLRNKFYRAFGLPQIVPGGTAGSSTDQRTIYLAFEQLVSQRQRYLEQQIKTQLGLTIKFNPPTTIMELIGRDETKDAGAPLTGFQQSELNPAAAPQ